MINSRRILFLVASEQQLPGIRFSLKNGFAAYTLDNNPANPGHELADKSFNIDVYDEKAVINTARELSPAAIVNFVSSHGILSGIKAREALGLKGINRLAFEIVSSKQKFREFLFHNDFPSPAVITSKEQCATSNSKKYIVKPIHGGGSQGIRKLNGSLEVKSFLDSDEYIDGSYIVEEFIEYDHRLNGDVLVLDNEIVYFVVGDYYYGKDHEFVSYATACPSIYDNQRVREFVSEFIKKVNYGTGALNFEIIIKDGFFYFVEINPRHSGNYLHEVMSLTYGVDVAEENVKILLDGDYQITPSPPNNNEGDLKSYSAIALVFSKEKGAFVDLKLKSALSKKIKKLVVFKKPGDKVTGFSSLYDRIALMVLSFKTRKEMEEVLENFSEYYTLNLK